MRLEALSKQIGARTLFAGADLVVREGDRIGLVGPNGAGKSTLLRVLAGDDTPDAGQIHLPRHARIGMLRQEVDPKAETTVRAEAASALASLDALEAELRRLEQEMAAETESGEVSNELAARYDRVSGEFEHGGGFEREARVAATLAGLGFDDDACDRPLSSFSGGWLMRVELAKLLLARPEVMLLDEPTNHLDLPAIQWFEATLDAYPGAVVVVSHDRTFLRRHVGRVAELDGLGGFSLYEGNYDRYLEQRDQRREELLARKANQDREIAQMERFVERFRAKATKARQAQSRVKALEKIERIEVPEESKRSMRLRIPDPPRSGETAMTLEHIEKSYGENRVYDGIDFSLRRGERVALAGPNGAGKSTLLRIIAGALDIDAGERIPGHNVQVAFYAQHQLEALDERLSVIDELGRAANTADVPRLRGHLGAFLFSGDDVDKKVSVLSGGEKARLALAKMLLHPANVLVLDEPTNHLDITACEVLEEALRDFAGTLVFVSHDRSFINALATRVIEVKHGVLREFLGNYDDYLHRLEGEETAASEAAASAAAPADAPASESAAPARALTKEDRQRERERRKARDRITRRIARQEEEIQAAEAEVEAIGWQLGDPDVYSDADRVAALAADRDAAQEKVDALYREWERLATELESLEDAASPSD